MYLEATFTADAFYARHGFQKIGEGSFSRASNSVSIEIVKIQREICRRAILLPPN